MKIYKTVAMLTLLYGSESGVFTKRQETHMQAVEMKFLRAVKGCRRADRI